MHERSSIDQKWEQVFPLEMQSIDQRWEQVFPLEIQSIDQRWEQECSNTVILRVSPILSHE